MYSKVGELGNFTRELKTIIKESDSLTYKLPDGTVVKGFRNIMRAVRNGKIPESILSYKQYAMVIPRITIALRYATRQAQYELNGRGRFINIVVDENKIYEQKQATKKGDIPKVLSLEDQYTRLNKQLQSK